MSDQEKTATREGGRRGPEGHRPKLAEEDTEGQKVQAEAGRGRHRGPRVHRPKLAEDDTEGQKADKAQARPRTTPRARRFTGPSWPRTTPRARVTGPSSTKTTPRASLDAEADEDDTEGMQSKKK